MGYVYHTVQGTCIPQNVHPTVWNMCITQYGVRESHSTRHVYPTEQSTHIQQYKVHLSHSIECVYFTAYLVHVSHITGHTYNCMGYTVWGTHIQQCNVYLTVVRTCMQEYGICASHRTRYTVRGTRIPQSKVRLSHSKGYVSSTIRVTCTSQYLVRVYYSARYMYPTIQQYGTHVSHFTEYTVQGTHIEEYSVHVCVPHLAPTGHS